MGAEVIDTTPWLGPPLSSASSHWLEHEHGGSVWSKQKLGGRSLGLAHPGVTAQPGTRQAWDCSGESHRCLFGLSHCYYYFFKSLIQEPNLYPNSAGLELSSMTTERSRFYLVMCATRQSFMKLCNLIPVF